MHRWCLEFGFLSALAFLLNRCCCFDVALNAK
jgi:hypothetical protein